MGEKEIKPADDKPKPGPLDPGGDMTTRERPGTGNPNAKPEQPSNQGGGGSGRQSGGSGGSYTGSIDYGDGYTMGRNEAGDTYLNHPDGSTATWDAGSQTWKGDGGSTMGGDWSGGHRPTDFGPKR